MQRRTLFGLIIAAFLLQSAWAVYSQPQQKKPGPLRTERVARAIST